MSEPASKRCSGKLRKMDTEPDLDEWGADSGADWRFALLSLLVHLLFLSLFVGYGSSLAVRLGSPPEEKCVMVTLNGLDAPGGASVSGGIGKSGDVAAELHSEKPAAAIPPSVVRKAKVSHPESPHQSKNNRSVSVKSDVVRRPSGTVPFPATRPASETALTPATSKAQAATPAVTTAATVSGDAAARNVPPSSLVSRTGRADAGSGNGQGTSSGSGAGVGFGNGSGNGRGNSVGNGFGNGAGSIESVFGAADGPRFLRRIMPRFPRMAQVRGREGTVVLRLTLDKTGRLVNVEIVSGAGNGFDEAAVQAVRNSTFSPARKNGMPVACRAMLPVRFQLTSSG